jgi:phage-related holin
MAPYFDTLTKLFDHSLLKVMVGLTISFLFGSLYNEALMAIVILAVMDVLTGLTATYHEDKPVSSRRFMRKVYSLTVYLLAISAGYFADLTIPGSFIQGTMIAFVGCTEFLSILENIGRMGYQTPQKLLNTLKLKKENL